MILTGLAMWLNTVHAGEFSYFITLIGDILFGAIFSITINRD